MSQTIIGVYVCMPLYLRGTTQFEKWMETLDNIQCIIDNGAVSPVIVMNVQLLRDHRIAENGIKDILLTHMVCYYTILSRRMKCIVRT